jgi:uncharacterized membrane protein YdbT with pleckstrin-like domain
MFRTNKIDTNQTPLKIENSNANLESTSEFIKEEIDEQKYHKLCKELEELFHNNYEKKEYVFKAPNYGVIYFVIGILSIFEMFFWGSFVIALGTLIYSTAYIVYAITGVVISLIFIFVNIYLITYLIRRIQFLKRYKKYELVLKNCHIEFIDDLVNKLGIHKKTIVKDLCTAIKMQLIPQGHIGNEVIMISDDIFNNYKKNSIYYDKYFKSKSKI